MEWADAVGIGRRVLIVEDEMLVCMLLEDFLSELGYEVVATAGRLHDACSRIDEGAFDFAVIDLNLGGADAYPLAEQLAARVRPFLSLPDMGLRV